MKHLNRKYIWIIGASSGIGAALAKELAKRGAIVAVSARTKEKLEAVAQEMKGDQHIVAELDVTNPSTLKTAKNKILETFPRIDSTIYLAAIYKEADKKEDFLDFIKKILAINIGGVFNTINVIISDYKKQGNGQLVLCGSVAGYRGLPNGQPYSATKAAIINLAESLKVELEPENVDVKLICPGFVKTDLTAQNDFEMPFIIEPEQAAIEIANGLTRKKFEIHFPKQLTYIMKLLKIVPYIIFFSLTKQMLPNSKKDGNEYKT